MSATYRFSLLRSSGWTRLGLAGAVGVLFGTPMLWALGVFGQGDDSIQRAVIFLFAGLWFFVGIGWLVGWAIHGFMVRIKDADDDDDGPARRPSPGPAHAPAHGPAHGPAQAHPPGRPGH